MKSTQFKVAALTSELNLNKIASHFGINRKFKWEELLTLKEGALKGVLREPANKAIYVFPYGSMAFINCEHHEIMDVLRYMAEIEKSLSTITTLDYTEDYRITRSTEEEGAIHNDRMITPDEKPYDREIVATVLAKSVALERIEFDINILLDEIEDTVTYLRQGQLAVSDEKLAKMSSRILGFQLSTLSSIMLLDKPEITWAHEQAGVLYDKLSLQFELNDRYQNMRHKTEMIMDITNVFAGLAHAKRGNRLEWAIIILFGIELCLSIFGMIFK